jgi:hypothetical protein
LLLAPSVHPSTTAAQSAPSAPSQFAANRSVQQSTIRNEEESTNTTALRHVDPPAWRGVAALAATVGWGVAAAGSPSILAAWRRRAFITDSACPGRCPIGAFFF